MAQTRHTCAARHKLHLRAIERRSGRLVGTRTPDLRRVKSHPLPNGVRNPSLIPSLNEQIKTDSPKYLYVFTLSSCFGVAVSPNYTAGANIPKDRPSRAKGYFSP